MIQDYLEPIVAYLRQHPHVGELFAFLVALAESLPIIGTIIPGSVTMTAVGTLIGAGILPGFTTIIWATLGAFCGDTIGFWLGSHYNEKIVRIWPFSKHPKWLTKSEDFIHRHGGKSILIGRFIGPARSTVPMVAGLLKLNFWRFVIAAIPAAILWAILYMVPGILLGALSLELPPHKATEFILIGLAIIIALWFIFWVIQRFFRELAKLINRLIDKLWNYLNCHHPTHFIIPLITNRQNPRDHHQLTLVLLSLLSLLLFVVVFISAITSGFLTHLNQPLFHFLQSLRNEPSDRFFILLTLLLKPQLAVVISALITLGLLLKKQWRTAWFFLVLMLTATLFVFLFKHLYYSPRPHGFLLYDKSSSFPSGHTTLSVALFGFLAFITASLFNKKWHWIPYLIAGLFIFLVSLSRLYLGAHWFTDILGAYFLGFAILLAIIASYRRMPKSSSIFAINPWLFGGILMVAFLLPWSIYSATHYQKTKTRFTPKIETLHISLQQWWQSPLQYLPLYRKNRFGRPVQPFNLQWAAKLSVIKPFLLKRGWKAVHPKPSVQSALIRFTSYSPIYHMPLFPWLYQYEPAKLVMVKRIPNQKAIVELRLWSTHIQFTDSKKALWIGSINFHIPVQKLMTLKRRHEISLRASGGIKMLLQNIKGFQVKMITIPTDLQPSRIRALNWDGRVMLISSF